jgi:fructuronate reductase
MKLNLSDLAAAGWDEIALPKYNIGVVRENTRVNPTWLHFGAGNIFRGFISSLQDTLLNAGIESTGIIAADTFDFEIIDRIFTEHDNLTLNVSLMADGSVKSEVLASVCEALKADSSDKNYMERFRQIAIDPSLQMISFTITEKGYAVKNTQGELMPVVKEDIANGPGKSKHAMSFVAGLLYERYKAGRLPVALVSMDNCSHNGEKLKSAVMTIANGWLEAGHVDSGFIDYISDESIVAFPWSMIDKITPRPSEKVQKMLEDMGMEDIAPIITSKKTFIAPFVNAEQPQYLVIEDSFPNGRPALEKAGVYLTDRDTVNKTERMKVTTCLNPLHTALAVYGCMLGYTLICEEMKDSELTRLVNRLGYVEGLPVVTDPGIISPKEFIDEVVKKRLPNPFMPDAPQRIATDTSQKVGIRFGETIKSYAALGKTSELKAIPLAIAGWLRYLLGVDDNGEPIEISADPLKDELCAHLAGIELGKPESYCGQLKAILSNETIFGSDLCALGMDKLIEEIFVKEIAGKGAVRATLKEYLD